MLSTVPLSAKLTVIANAQQLGGLVSEFVVNNANLNKILHISYKITTDVC